MAAAMERLLDAIRAAGLSGRAHDTSETGSIAAAPGAYALLIKLERPVTMEVAGRKADGIGPGFYVYCGSARGPGGLRARIARHFRRDKSVRWHVDTLTLAAARLAAVPVPGAVECDLAAALHASGVFRFPVAGFGSSDCRRCKSHLLQLTT